MKMLKLKPPYLKTLLAVKNSRPDLESTLKTNSEKWVYIPDEKKVSFCWPVLFDSKHTNSSIGMKIIENYTGQQNKTFFSHRGYKSTFLNQFSMLIPNLVLNFSQHIKFCLDMVVLILALFHYLHWINHI